MVNIYIHRCRCKKLLSSRAWCKFKIYHHNMWATLLQA